MLFTDISCIFMIKMEKLFPLILLSLLNLVQERMTLKHKNHNPWAARIIQRGLHNQDEGTRAAIHEQLQRHAELTRKMKSMKGSSSSGEDSSEEEEDDNSAGSDQDMDYKILGKAKEKTMKVLEEEEEVPKSGLLSLPFMVISIPALFFLFPFSLKEILV